MSLCPCGSQHHYDNCCGLYLDKQQQPQTPEQLMRSRYTAYSLANINYIKNTMKGNPLIGFNEQEAERWAKSVEWISLEVMQSYTTEPNTGFVEFIARFYEHKQIKAIHELSEFHKENDAWFYVNRITQHNTNKIKTARNNPCPCGSGKKFKNCHAK